MGACGPVVFVFGYGSAGRGFESRCGWILSLGTTLICSGLAANCCRWQTPCPGRSKTTEEVFNIVILEVSGIAVVRHSIMHSLRGFVAVNNHIRWVIEACIMQHPESEGGP